MVDASFTCPSLPPKDGEYCPALGGTCDYSTSCGGSARATCGTAGWKLETLKACGCPPTPPGSSVECEVAMKCEYDGPCGKITSECAGPGSRWATSIGSCPTGTCPMTEPAVGDPCTASGKCSYDTACGNETVYCNSSGYTVSIDYARCPGCPTTEPVDGTSCGSGMNCWYASSCGKRNAANCVGGTWKVTRPDCTK